MRWSPRSIFARIPDVSSFRDDAAMYAVVASRLRSLEVFLQLLGSQAPEETHRQVLTFLGQQAGGTANVLDAWYQAQRRGGQA